LQPTMTSFMPLRRWSGSVRIALAYYALDFTTAREPVSTLFDASGQSVMSILPTLGDAKVPGIVA
jgi:hypothetical protein